VDTTWSWYLCHFFILFLIFVDSAYCITFYFACCLLLDCLRRRLYYTTMRAFIPIVTLAVAAVPSICAFAPMPTHKRSSSALQANDEKFSFPNPVAEIGDMFSSLDDVIDDFFNKRVSENHTIYTFCSSYHIILCSYHGTSYLYLTLSKILYLMLIHSYTILHIILYYLQSTNTLDGKRRDILR